jgi:hypothetical protein
MTTIKEGTEVYTPDDNHRWRVIKIQEHKGDLYAHCKRNDNGTEETYSLDSLSLTEDL